MRLLAFILGLATLASASSAIQAQTAPESTNTPAALPYEASAAAEYSRARLAQDIKAVETYRPDYQFWQYIFTIPDGRIAFGSANDGRLIATFPTAGDWTREDLPTPQPAMTHRRFLPRSSPACCSRLHPPSASIRSRFPRYRPERR